jgi:hypothetical protein
MVVGEPSPGPQILVIRHRRRWLDLEMLSNSTAVDGSGWSLEAACPGGRSHNKLAVLILESQYTRLKLSLQMIAGPYIILVACRSDAVYFNPLSTKSA